MAFSDKFSFTSYATHAFCACNITECCRNESSVVFGKSSPQIGNDVFVTLNAPLDPKMLMFLLLSRASISQTILCILLFERFYQVCIAAYRLHMQELT